ncbi:MAG: hypothetical protein JNM43_17420 [Planctomycetaceae bacterium]|nr:hypothetical protein [Planctomycetaceae bacterium]
MSIRGLTPRNTAALLGVALCPVVWLGDCFGAEPIPPSPVVSLWRDQESLDGSTADNDPGSHSPEAISSGIFRTTQPESLFGGYVRPASYVDEADQGPPADVPPVPPESPAGSDPLQIPTPYAAPVEPEAAPVVKPQVISPDDGCSDQKESLKDLEAGRCDWNLERMTRERYENYRTDESVWSWIPGGGQDFGWFSMMTSTYEPRGKRSGVGGMINIHWLGGPYTSPLPSRVYDFGIGFQTRDSLSDRFSYDLAASVGAYSDFEDSARDGIRFPSHAVGMVHVDSSTDIVFGLDYLDRDDYPLLPVFGVSLYNLDLPGLRMDLIFPRPRIEYALSPDSRAYIAGNLGGGTWDIEFPDETNKVMTYRDFRLLVGFEKADDSSLGALEFGYVFGRKLEFRNDPVTTDFHDAFILQWVHRH